MALKKIVHIGDGRFSEKTSTAVTIIPGTLLERVTDLNTVQAQSVAEAAGTYPEAMVAVENSLAGDEVGTVWPISSQIKIYHAEKGDELYLRLEDSEVVTFGAFLTPNGTNGTMKLRDTATNPPFAMALEAKDALSDAASADLLIRCVIL